MPSTHLSLHYHVVFSTKDRIPMAAEGWRLRLHEYLGGIAHTLETAPEGIGGTADHVHLLLGLRATHRLADVVRDLKRGSSEWVHREIGYGLFAWQEGYGAFTVSASQLATVKKYIAGQAEHHRRHGFQTEYLTLLRRSGVAFDEHFLW